MPSRRSRISRWLGVISTSSDRVSVSGDSSRERYLVSTSVVAQSAAAATGTSVIGAEAVGADAGDDHRAGKGDQRARSAAQPMHRSRRNSVEPRMMNSGPVESSVTICQIGTPAAKP